jgi:hypothetical protein
MVPDTKKKSSIYSVASEFVESGISVIPLRLDGSKAPNGYLLPQVCEVKTRRIHGTWEPFQARLPSVDELQSWYRSKAGIGLVGGIVSGGLEIFDFDDGSLFEPWRKSIESIVRWLPVVQTPSGGNHVFYRCEVVSGNQKIAVDPTRRKQTLIETRGEGGYVCAVGSPFGIHRDGLYVQTMGPPLPEIPTISVADRKALWKAARVFDKAETLKSFLPKPKTTPRKSDGNTPWDDFNRRAPVELVLKGWKQQSETSWTRPGKDFGTSATVRPASDGNEVIVVFSTNAGAISKSGSQTSKTWSKFEAFKLLNYGGDGKAAAKAAMALGYGGSR